VSGWKIGDETYTLSEISSEIRKRNSDVATNLVEMIRVDRDSNSKSSVGLTIISKVKKSSQNLFQRHPTYPGATPEMCEESFNDALLAIFIKIDKFDASKSSLNTWLTNMIYWAFQTNYRTFIRESKGIVQQSIHEEDSGSGEEGIDSWLSKFESSSEDITKGAWQGDMFVEAFKKLSLEDQALIRYAGNDLEPTQLVNEGYIAGVSVNAVRVRLSRARKRFSSHLEEAGWKE
jgi:DNA-directed RNA polymerase specialized sigma24 family protein